MLGGALVYFYNTNDQFQARLAGRNIYHNASATGIDLQGSGRTIFWINGIKGWSEGNTYELLLGRGYTQVVQRNFEVAKIQVFSHNQFVDALSQHGLIGLVLLCVFYLSIYRLINKYKGSPYSRLSLSLLYSAILFSFFQNEMYFNYAVIFSLVLVLLVKSPLKLSD